MADHIHICPYCKIELPMISCASLRTYVCGDVTKGQMPYEIEAADTYHMCSACGGQWRGGRTASEPPAEAVAAFMAKHGRTAIEARMLQGWPFPEPRIGDHVITALGRTVGKLVSTFEFDGDIHGVVAIEPPRDVPELDDVVEVSARLECIYPLTCDYPVVDAFHPRGIVIVTQLTRRVIADKFSSVREAEQTLNFNLA